MKLKSGYEISWISSVEHAVFLRATVVAVVLGSVLTLVNQFGWVSGNEPLQVLQLTLVFLLPFGVVATAQVAGAYQARIDAARRIARPRQEGFITTVFSHGIPARALAISLVFGSLNAIAVITVTLSGSGDLSSVSVVPLVQAYLLPLVFASLSQGIAYRRTQLQTG